MTASEILTFLLIWGILGCLLFSIFVVIAFRSGLVYTARKEDGTLKERIPPRGVLAMAILPLGLIGLNLASDYFGLIQRGIFLGYGRLFLLNYSVYVLLFLFDTFVIDGFVIPVWRPAFLRIPAAMGKGSMQKHILISLPIGLFVGAILTLLGTALAYFLWLD